MAGDLKEFQVSEAYIAMSRVRGLLSIKAAAFVGFQEAQSAEALPKPAQAEQVTVTGQATGSLTSASSDKSAKQETQIPGGFTVKSAGEMRMGRASNLRICCNARREFSFNRRAVPRSRRFQFAVPGLHQKTNRLA